MPLCWVWWAIRWMTQRMAAGSLCGNTGKIVDLSVILIVNIIQNIIQFLDVFTKSVVACVSFKRVSASWISRCRATNPASRRTSQMVTNSKSTNTCPSLLHCHPHVTHIYTFCLDIYREIYLGLIDLSWLKLWLCFVLFSAHTSVAAEGLNINNITVFEKLGQCPFRMCLLFH